MDCFNHPNIQELPSRPPQKSREEWRFTDFTKFKNELIIDSGNKNFALIDLNGQNDFVQLKEVEPESVIEVEGNFFLEMNHRLVKSFYQLEIAKDAQLERPIYIDYYVDQTMNGHLINLGTIIKAHKSCKVTIVERFFDKNDGKEIRNRVFLNCRTTIEVHNNASVEHIRFQQLGPKSSLVHQVNAAVERDGTLQSFILDMGADFSRNELEINLLAEGSNCHANGLYIVNGTSEVDHYTSINHVSPHTESDQLYRGIIGQQGRAVFNGKVHVHKGAMQTKSGQLNNNILLSKEARIQSNPTLLIDNDDVKCSHGSTTGQLDSNQAFYLQTRGYSRLKAFETLAKSFSLAVIEKMRLEEVKTFFINKIEEQEICTQEVLNANDRK